VYGLDQQIVLLIQGQPLGPAIRIEEQSRACSKQKRREKIESFPSTLQG